MNKFIAMGILFISFQASAALVRWDLTLTATSDPPSGAFGLEIFPSEFLGFVTFDLSGNSGGEIIDFGLTIGDTTWTVHELNQLGGDSTFDRLGLSIVNSLRSPPMGRNLVLYRAYDGSVSTWSARDTRGLDVTIYGNFYAEASQISEPSPVKIPLPSTALLFLSGLVGFFLRLK